MSSFTTYAKKLDRLKNSAREIFESVVLSKKVQDYARKLNEKQLDMGLLSDKSELPPYSAFTTQQKILKGQQIDPMNLKDTGGFRDDILIRMKRKFAFLESEDEKNKELQKRYGKLVFGLFPEHEEMVLNLIYKLYTNEAKKALR